MGATVASSQNARAADPSYHFQLHGREQTPLDSVLRKRNGSFDDFVTEHYHDEIAATLAKWRHNLLETPPHARAITATLLPDAALPSWHPNQSVLRREDAMLTVHQLSFDADDPPTRTIRARMARIPWRPSATTHSRVSSHPHPHGF